MLRWVIVLMFLATPALADSITIGTLSYLGPDSQGLPQYQIELNTNGVTAQPFTNIGGVIGNSDSGEAFAIPITAAFGEIITGGTTNCPCTSIFFLLALNVNSPRVTFLLANGQPFTALALDTSTLLPLPGQSFIQPGQSVTITLTSAPEPGTVFLMGSGLIGLLLRRWLFIGHLKSMNRYITH